MTAGDVARTAFDWIFRVTAVREARAGLAGRDECREVATRQAKLLLEVARRVAEPAAALPPGAQPAVLLAMYRDAIYWALAARYTRGGEPPADLRALWDASNPQTVVTAAASPPDNEASAALRRTLLDDYDPRSLAVTDDDVARARAFAEALLWDLEAPRRHVAWLLAQRWLRIALIAAALLLLAAAVRSLTLGPNLAQGKPFRLSSSWPGWTECVAENGCNGLMFHTDTDNEPWVEIDLGAPRKIQRVEVVNRGDCCAERAVPLIVELGGDRKTWTPVARRDDAFASWTATFAAKTARYVRLRVAKRGVLHLQAISVR